MSSWGTGSGHPRAEAHSPEEAESEPESESSSEEGALPGVDEKSAHDRVKRSNEDGSRTVEEVIPEGEYRFMPVYGFNEANAARWEWRENNDPDFDNPIGPEHDRPIRVGDRRMTWWHDDSLAPRHNFVLINPVGFTTIPPDDLPDTVFRESLEFEKGEHFIYCDSGGFQVMTRGGKVVDSEEEHHFDDMTIHPKALLEWQVKNADAGATLDMPPYVMDNDTSIPTSRQFTYEEWIDELFGPRLDKSIENYAKAFTRLEALRNEGNERAKDFMLFPVLHGKKFGGEGGPPWDNMLWWKSAIEDCANKFPDDIYEGMTLKPQPVTNLSQIALHLGFAAEYLTHLDHLHVLQVGGMSGKALIMYFVSLMGDEFFVTSDASSYSTGSLRRQFYLPGPKPDRRTVTISNRSDEEKVDDHSQNDGLDRLPCRCEVCRYVESELGGIKYITEGTGTAQNAVLNLHNLTCALDADRTLNALIRAGGSSLPEKVNPALRNAMRADDPGRARRGDGEDEDDVAEFWRYIQDVCQPRKVMELWNAMKFVQIAVEDGLEATQGYGDWDVTGNSNVWRYEFTNSAASW